MSIEGQRHDTLPWRVHGKTFADGSQIDDWVKVYQSPDWHWQYDTHEMTFAIYEHDHQYWKLYEGRIVEEGETEYRCHYGGQACRMVEVEYLTKARSPHSSMLFEEGEREWVRTYEFDSAIHRVVRAGERSEKYGEPYSDRRDRQATPWANAEAEAA